VRRNESWDWIKRLFTILMYLRLNDKMLPVDFFSKYYLITLQQIKIKWLGGKEMKKLAIALGFIGYVVVLGGGVSLKAHVDPKLGYVSETEKVEIANPQPVQLIFEFQTKGAANARATKEFSDLVFRVVNESKLFSSVSSDPVENGALLSISINNIPEEDAFGKGFGTGLTMGLASSTVTDFYEGKAQYVAAPNSDQLSTEKNHAIHSVVGAGASPEGMTPSATLLEAVEVMGEQIVQHLLNELAQQPSFNEAGQDNAEEADIVTSQLKIVVELG